MKRLTLVLCSIIALLFISAAAYVLLVPKRVTPMKLPVTKNALGRTVTLKSVKRISRDVVQVSFEVEEPQKINYVESGMQASIPGDLPEKECEDAGGSFGEYIPLAKGGGYMRMNCNFKVPAGVSSINLSRGFEIERLSKRVNISFKDIPVADLPVTKSFKGTTVTLQSVMVNRPVDTLEWDIFSGQQGLAAYSACYGLQVRITSRQDFIHSGGEKLGDGRGNVWDGANVYRAALDGGSNIPQVYTEPILSEKIVGCFDRERAYRMWERRYEKEYNAEAKELAKSVASHTYLYGFTPIYPPPEKISFSMSGSYPSDKRDKARIEFRNVPISR